MIGESITLQQYFDASRGARSNLARKADIAVESLDRLRRGETASLRVALKIHQSTEGKVNALSLVNDGDRDILETFYRSA